MQKKGNKYGVHRVIEPAGVLPQPANKIDNNMDDILCNDTDKTFVLDIEGEMIELAPNQAIYVDWFTDVYVAEIK